VTDKESFEALQIRSPLKMPVYVRLTRCFTSPLFVISSAPLSDSRANNRAPRLTLHDPDARTLHTLSFFIIFSYERINSRSLMNHYFLQALYLECYKTRGSGCVPVYFPVGL